MSAFDKLIQSKFTDVELEPGQMHDYQTKIALPFLRANPFSALFIDMGLGKTITSATLITELLDDFHPGKILVIGPLRVMTDTWPTEFKKWRHTAPFSFTLIREDDDDPRIKAAQAIDRGDKEERGWERETLELAGMEEKEIRALLGKREEARVRLEIRGELACSKQRIHFINREQLVWLVNFYGPKWPYRTVIIDESSSFKDYSTTRFKALAKVRNTEGLITRLHELTATPAAETYEHLFSQLYLLDRGKRLGKNITAYRSNYFSYDRWKMKWLLRNGCEEEILDKIKDICLVMKAEDYLKVDKPTIITKPVTLPASAVAIYEAMQRDFVVSLPDGSEVEAETAAALSSKLLQIASGVLYETVDFHDLGTDEHTKVKKVHRIHDAKIETLREIVESLQGEPVLVAYHFKSSLDRLKKAFPKAVVLDKDGKCIKDWNARRIPMLLMHPQSGGHGLNLQKGGHNIVFFDLVWSLEVWLQLIGRLARQGQTKPVLVQVLTAVGTLDNDVFGALRDKEDAQDKLFTILKRLIKRYRELRKS